MNETRKPSGEGAPILGCVTLLIVVIFALAAIAGLAVKLFLWIVG